MYGTQHANIPSSPPRTPTKSATQMRREAAGQRSAFRSSLDNVDQQQCRDRSGQRRHHSPGSAQARPAAVNESLTRPNSVEVADAVACEPTSPDGAPSTPMDSSPPFEIRPPASLSPVDKHDHTLQRSGSAPRRRPPNSLTSQAVLLGIRPPWDDSPPPPPPHVRTLAAEEISRKPLPSGMNVASLLHYVEKVCDRMRCTGRRVERTMGILESASGHAMMCYTDSDAAAADRLSTSFASGSTRYRPSDEEWKLLLAFERLGCVADECTNAMFAHRERLVRLTHHLADSLQTLEAHHSSLDQISRLPTNLGQQPRTAATDFELFRMQADANYASELEQHVRVACTQAMKASRSQSSNVEAAVARRSSSLHGVAASPQRLRPAQRLQSLETGVDGVIASYVKQGAHAQSTSALLRGRYPVGRSASPPRGRRLKTKEASGKQPPAAESPSVPKDDKEAASEATGAEGAGTQEDIRPPYIII